MVGAVCFALPVLEIATIIWVGHQIGAGWTLVLLLAEVPLGLAIIQRAGRRSLATMTAAMRGGQIAAADLNQNGWAVAGGVLLIIPGFLTDVLALALMVPRTRALLGRAVLATGATRQPCVPPTPQDQGTDAEPRVVRGDVL